MSDRTEEIRARVEKEAEELVGFHLEGGEVVYDNGNYYHADPNHQALWDAMLIKLTELTALRQEVTRLTKSLAAADAYFPATALEVVNLRQENARLKGALANIATALDDAQIGKAGLICIAALSPSPARESDHAGL